MAPQAESLVPLAEVVRFGSHVFYVCVSQQARPANVIGDFAQPPVTVVCPAGATLYRRDFKTSALTATSLTH